MKDALIICPVGCDLTFDDRYSTHWRYTDRGERNYDILAVVYNDYRPEENTYDHIMYMRGHKWQIVREIAHHIDMSKYKYIAAVDDDLITDQTSFNLGLVLAKKYDFPIWQLSMIEGSGIIYDCLKQNKQWVMSETNFVEMGSTFFRLDKFIHFMDFLKELDFTVGWGIDKVFCDVLECHANVVHAASIYHPPNTIKPSYYDQSEAMKEMNHMISEVYPKVFREKYNKPDWKFNDQQIITKVWAKNR